jgi:hypothetical protein
MFEFKRAMAVIFLKKKLKTLRVLYFKSTRFSPNEVYKLEISPWKTR